MKTTCIKTYLKEGLQILNRITTHNSTLPILSSIYLEANKGVLTMKATNLEIGVTHTIRAAVDKKGSVAVSGSILSGIIEGIGDKNISLEKKNEGIEIKTPSYNSEIKGSLAEDFPLIPQISGEPFLKIKANQLSTAIEQVLPSIAISNMRPDLAGIYLKKTKEDVKFVTTDGFRLSEKTLYGKKNNTAEDQAIIIPGRTATEIMRIFSKNEEEVEIIVADSQIAVKGANTYLVSRIIDGNYPDYTQIIPQEFQTEVKIDKNEFLNAIKLTAIFSSTEANDLVLEIDPDTETINLTAQSKETGKANKQIKGKIKGQKEKIVLNHRFLLDGVEKIVGNKLRLLISQANRPVLLKGQTEGNGDVDFIYIISPIKK